MVFPAEAEWPTRIKICRMMQGATQEDLANYMHCTRKQIYLWETGKTVPRLPAKRLLAKWAGVPVETLFKGCKDIQ